MKNPYIERFIGTERYERWRQLHNYRDRVDMASSLLFFNIVNGANEFYAGNDWDEILLKRAIGTGINILTYKQMNRYVDWMRSVFNAKGGLKKWFADAAAVETFGTAIYGMLQFATSRDPSEAWTATKHFAGYIAFTGFPYGSIRDCFRDFFGADKPEEELYEEDV